MGSLGQQGKIKKLSVGIFTFYMIVTVGMGDLKEMIVDTYIPLFHFAKIERVNPYSTPPWGAFWMHLPIFMYCWEESPKVDFKEESYFVEVEEEPAEDLTFLQENFNRENEAVRQTEERLPEEEIEELPEPSGFLPQERQQEYNLEEFQEFDHLFETFYAMDPHTMVGMEELNVERLWGTEVTIDKTKEGPHILLYHTHSQEAFKDSTPGDPSTSIVGAGDKLAQLLTEKYGYQILHHKGEYDVETRDGAYNRALPELERIIKENPQIQLVIDLHRDGIDENTQLLADVNGRRTAKFMFFNGLSRTKSTGDIDYLYNPYQSENLALSFQMQKAANEFYPGITRKIYLNGYRYNMHLRRSMLIELGAQTNTVEEIMNAIDPLAHILDLVLSGEAKKDS